MNRRKYTESANNKKGRQDLPVQKTIHACLTGPLRRASALASRRRDGKRGEQAGRTRIRKWGLAQKEQLLRCHTASSMKAAEVHTTRQVTCVEWHRVPPRLLFLVHQCRDFSSTFIKPKTLCIHLMPPLWDQWFNLTYVFIVDILSTRR